MPELTSAVDAMTLWNEKNNNKIHDGSPIYTEQDFAAFLSGEGKKDANWNDLVIAKWVPQTQHDLSISGGTEKYQYYVSMGYLYQEGFFKSGDLNYDKYNIRGKISRQNW